jgi:hypothetical protein
MKSSTHQQPNGLAVNPLHTVPTQMNVAQGLLLANSIMLLHPQPHANILPQHMDPNIAQISRQWVTTTILTGKPIQPALYDVDNLPLSTEYTACSKPYSTINWSSPAIIDNVSISHCAITQMEMDKENIQPIYNPQIAPGRLHQTLVPTLHKNQEKKSATEDYPIYYATDKSNTKTNRGEGPISPT